MKGLFIAIIIIAFFIGCKPESQSTKITGDLYYTWLKLGSFYGQPDSMLTQYLQLKDSIGYEGLMKEDSIGTKYIRVLEENNLLTSPFIYLRTDEGKTILLYLDKDDYKKFIKFNYQDLIDKKQKVRIVAEADSLWNKMFLCKSLISVRLIEGKTLQQQKKFKIEEYR